MGKLRSNQKGFGTVEIVLILVILGLIGLAGFMVYNHQHKSKPSSATTTKTIPPATKVTSFVNSIQDDGSIIQITPTKIAKTPDEVAILTALHNTCTGSSTNVTVNHLVFDGNSNFIQDGTHASINTSACDPVAKSVDDLQGSGAEYLLHKNSSGTWIVDASGQMAPSCDKIDGLGYPTSILSACYDGSTSRAPKQ